jgi:hypothetical protein
MKINKLDRFETKSASEPSPEQIQQSKQTFVNLLTPIIEKMLKNPGDIKPVAESFEELARQAKSGVKRSAELTKIISGGEKVPQKLTDIDTGTSEKVPPKFTDIELELLRKIENGEY